MTDREKLIELLSEDLVEYCNVDIIAGHCKIRAITFDVDRFADHLLANGVIIPVRCKDCKWWRDFDCMNANGASSLVLNEDFFCAAGERKEK